MGQVVWYSHLFLNFPQFIVIHTVKGFGIVNKAEIDVFLELSSGTFLMIQQMSAIWSLVPLPFPKPAWTSGSSLFTHCWSLAWRILSITLLACEMSVIMFFGSSKKQESSLKTSTSPLLTMPKPLTLWIITNCGKFWQRWEYQTTWPASGEICMQVRKQQLDLDMEQQTGSK